MSAKEMFEELGYKIIVNDDDWIIYENNEEFTKKITFSKLNKQYWCGRYFIPDYLYLVINIRLNKAIQKQIEELGW